MLHNENVYVAVEGEEENWIRFEMKRMPGSALPVFTTPELAEGYMQEQGRDDFQLKQVRFGEIISKLRNDELGITHVTTVGRKGPHTRDKATFLRFVG